MDKQNTNTSGDGELENRIALEVLEVLAQAKYGVGYLLLDKQQQKHLVVDAGDSCRNLLALAQAHTRQQVQQAQINILTDYQVKRTAHRLTVPVENQLSEIEFLNQFRANIKQEYKTGDKL